MFRIILVFLSITVGGYSLTAQVEIGPLSGSYADYVSPEFVHETDSSLFYIYRKNIESAFLIKVRRSDLKVQNQFELPLNPRDPKMERSIQSWRVKDDVLIFFAVYINTNEELYELWVHHLDLNSGKSLDGKLLKKSEYRKELDQVTLDIWYLESINQYYAFEYNKRHKRDDRKESLSIFDSDFEEIRTIQFDSEEGSATSTKRPLFDKNGSVYFNGLKEIIHLDAKQDFQSTKTAIPTDLVEGPEYLMPMHNQWIGENGNPYFLLTHKKLYSGKGYFDTREIKSSDLTEGIYILEYDPTTKSLKTPISHSLSEGSMNLFTTFSSLVGVRSAITSASGSVSYPESGRKHDAISLKGSKGESYYAVAYTERVSVRTNNSLFSEVNQYDRFIFALDENDQILWHKNIDYLSKGVLAGKNIYGYDGYFGFNFFKDGASLALLYNERADNLNIESYDEREAMKDPKDAVPVMDQINPANGEHQQFRLDHLLDPAEEDFALDVSSFFKSSIDGKYYYILSEKKEFKVARTKDLLSN